MRLEFSLRPLRRALSGTILLGLAAAWVGCTFGSEARPVAGTPVKLLFITLDTLRADRLGVYGNRRPITPAIDRLARSATTFADVTCSMPTTLPGIGEWWMKLHKQRADPNRVDSGLITG